jgi:hypothetical protein
MATWKWAQRAWPEAEWISGTGDWAVVAYCPRGLTVTLHQTEEGAIASKAGIDRTGCGGRCVKDHEIFARWEVEGTA